MNQLAARIAHQERGGSLVGTIIVLVIITVLIGVFVTNSINGALTAKSQIAKVAGMPAADAGITKIRGALQDGLMSEADGYVLSTEDLAKVAGGAVVLDNASSPQVPDEMRTVDSASVGSPFTMLESVAGSSGGETSYWQLYKVVRPDFTTASRSAVVVYIRAWRSAAPTATSAAKVAESRMIRVEYRTTGFSRYQLLSDTPIQVLPGTSIAGRVHSNGNHEGLEGDEDVSIEAVDGTVSCPGGKVRVSTAAGSVENFADSCAVREDTGKVVGFGSVNRAIEEISATCGADHRICVGDGTALATGEFYDVNLQGSLVTWQTCSIGGGCGSSGSHSISSASNPAAPGDVLHFRGDVRIRGASQGRLTVMAGTGADPAASMRIIDDVGSAPGPNHVLGLVTEGDIVVDVQPSGACPVQSINAALASASGSLTLPAEYLAATPTPGAATCAQPLNVTGSIATRGAPLLIYKWGAGYIGYDSRAFVFDPRFDYNIPPSFPMATKWSVTRWDNANEDCLVVGAAPDCR